MKKYIINLNLNSEEYIVGFWGSGIECSCWKHKAKQFETEDEAVEFFVENKLDRFYICDIVEYIENPEQLKLYEELHNIKLQSYHDEWAMEALKF